MDENYCKAISESKKGSRYALGHKLSEEVKAQISEKNKGKRRSPNTEFKKGMIPWNKGKAMLLETYEKCKGTMFKKDMKPLNTKKIIVINIIEGTEKMLNCKRDITEHCGMHHTCVNSYIKSGKLYKNKYLLKEVA